MPPVVEPEHPHWKSRNINIIMENPGHNEVSTVAKPVVLMTEATLKNACLNASGKLS